MPETLAQRLEKFRERHWMQWPLASDDALVREAVAVADDPWTRDKLLIQSVLRDAGVTVTRNSQGYSWTRTPKGTAE